MKKWPIFLYNFSILRYLYVIIFLSNTIRMKFVPKQIFVLLILSENHVTILKTIWNNIRPNLKTAAQGLYGHQSVGGEQLLPVASLSWVMIINNYFMYSIIKLFFFINSPFFSLLHFWFSPIILRWGETEWATVWCLVASWS